MQPETAKGHFVPSSALLLPPTHHTPLPMDSVPVHLHIEALAACMYMHVAYTCVHALFVLVSSLHMRVACTYTHAV
jgi:hypothetical protein